MTPRGGAPPRALPLTKDVFGCWIKFSCILVEIVMLPKHTPEALVALFQNTPQARPQALDRARRRDSGSPCERSVAQI